jgi:hypothetical protein
MLATRSLSKFIRIRIWSAIDRHSSFAWPTCHLPAPSAASRRNHRVFRGSPRWPVSSARVLAPVLAQGANSTPDFAPRTIDLLAFWAFPPIVSIHTYTFNSRDAAQNASQAIRGSEDNVVGLALKQRRPSTRHALVQQLAVPVGRAQLRTTQLAYSLFVLTPNTRRDEIGGPSHLEADRALHLSGLHSFCIEL